jgi:hypothetical protein
VIRRKSGVCVTATCGEDAAIQRSSSTETGRASMLSFTSTGVEPPLKCFYKLLTIKWIGLKNVIPFWCCWRLKPCLLLEIKRTWKSHQDDKYFLYKFIPHYSCLGILLLRFGGTLPLFFVYFLLYSYIWCIQTQIHSLHSSIAFTLFFPHCRPLNRWSPVIRWATPHT